MQPILLFFLFAALVSCTSTPKEPVKETKAENTWPGDMQHMSQDVRQLVPYLYDREAFHDPRNHDLIHQYLRDFSQSAKHVQPEMGRKYLGDDLLVDFALSNLTQDL